MKNVSPSPAPEVVQLLNGREHPVDGRDVDDRAAALFGHPRADDLAAQECPFDVDIHDLVERLLRIGLDRPDLLGRSIRRRVEGSGVDENVRRPNLARDLVNGIFDRAAIGHVDGEALGLEVEDGNTRALLLEPADDLTAEAARTARDDSDSAGQGEELAHRR